VSAHDVTDLVREQGLKADFVSLISHKLRTPLTPIMLYLSLIRDGTISGDEIGPAVQQLCGQVDRMHSLIERLIEFVSTTQDSRLSSRTKFSITGRLREIVETRDPAARGRVELEPGARPAFVAMHPSLFDVVVRNLIDNGLKFNDSAEPVVIVSGEVNGNCVTVSVRDNGRGIPPEQQKRIFDEFTQVERDFTGSVPGVGLGLAMVRRIVLAYGGRVDVASEVGTGSTLTVTLPAAPVSEEPVLITAPSR
jgi:signal transduction histidine kinase